MAERQIAASQEPAGSAGGKGPNLLGQRDFRLYWLGQTIALLGDQFAMIAMPWLVLQLTGNGLAMGTVLALAGIPRALLMLLGGAFSDRFSPRTMLLGSTLCRIGLVSLLGALVLSGAVQLWMLYALAFSFGVVDAFAYPAQSAMLPSLADREQLPQANAFVQGTAQVCMFLGPVVAGGLIAALSGSSAAESASLTGIGIAFLIDASGFVVSALTLWLVRLRALESGAASSASTHDSVLASIRTGLAAVWNDAPLRAYFLLIAGMNFLMTGPLAVGVPFLARTRLPEGVAAFGIVMSAFGGGSLLGIILAGVLKGRFERQTGRMSLLMSTMGIGLVAFGLSTATPLTAVMALGMGFANGYVVIQFMTWLQRRTAPQMLGRTMSLLMFSAVGLQPISTALAGALIDLNTTALFVGAGSILTVLVLATSTHPAIRHLDRDADEAGKRQAITLTDEIAVC